MADKIVELSNRLMLDLASASDLDWWCLAAARDLWRLARKLSLVLGKKVGG